MFSGYNRYLPYLEKNGNQLSEKIQQIKSGFFNDENIMKDVFSEQIVKHYDNSNSPINSFGKSIRANKNFSMLNNALLFDLKTEIPGAQTWRIDRTGSAHAVELREPFLDYELVEYSLTIPPCFKINTNNGIKKKYILQKLAMKFLPKEIVTRKKFPWGIPFYDFFRKEFLVIAENILEKSSLQKNSYLNSKTDYVKKICDNAKKIKLDDTKNNEINDNILRQILFLFNLDLWTKLFIENENFKNPTLELDKFV